MKDRNRDILEDYHPDLPGRLIYKVVMFAFKMILRFRRIKTVYHFDKESMKGKQVILLADHSAYLNPIYVLPGYSFVNFNAVVSLKHFFLKWEHFFYTHIGCIPKSLFEPDFLCVRQMMSVLKKGGSLCLFPEGIESVLGFAQPINPGTQSFLKYASVPVVLCKSYGSYLSRPSFGGKRCGPVELHYEILFTSEELKQMDNAQVYERILERFRYNDFQWNKEKLYSYPSKKGNAEGLENIIYICPKCKKEFFMTTEKDDIVCTSCGNRIRVEDTYALSPVGDSVMPYRDLVEWYNSQRVFVKEQIATPGFRCSYFCRIGMLAKNKPRKNPILDRGEGELVIDATGITYHGTFQGEMTTLFFDISAVPSFYFIPGKHNILCYQKEYYVFAPVTAPEQTVRYMMMVEELHNLVDPKWKKVSDDAFSLPEHP